MADLRKTKAEWLRFLGREVGSFLAVLGELQELEDRYARQRTRVVPVHDVDSVIGPQGVKLEGVNLTRNTSVAGFLWPRITGPQTPSTVDLYRGPGGRPQDLVATGQGPSGTVVTLKEQNGSGLRGQWDLPANAARQTTDRLRLLVVPDWLTQIDRVWDGSQPKDLEARAAFRDALAQVAANLGDSRRSVRDALERFAAGASSRGAAFLQAGTSTLFSDTPAARDPSGAVTRRRAGFLPTLGRAMQDDTRAGAQSVTGRRVQASAARFSPKNRGRGKVGPHVPREFCPAARWTFRCVRGGDTGHGGREEFACTVKLLNQDRELSFGGLVVGQSFSGPAGIGPFSLERVYTKGGDPTHDSLGRDSAASTAGERTGNTDNGVLHWRVERGPNGWDVSFFSSSVRAEPDLVAKAEGVATQTPFMARERGASGLTVLWRTGPNPQPGTEGTIDCNFFVVQNPDGVPDEFVVLTEVAPAPGRFQDLLAEQTGGTLPSQPLGQATIADGYVTAGTLVALLEGGR